MDELMSGAVIITMLFLILGISGEAVSIICDRIPAVRDWFEGNETEEDEDNA